MKIPPRLKKAAKKFRLTPRETEIIAAALGDSPRKTIADELGISIKTVDFHFKNIFKKISTRTRAGVVCATLG
jgi:DNA-binding CsgD family transcriptional regulator